MEILTFLEKRLEEVIAGIGVVIMCLMVFFQVVMRYVFSLPTSFAISTLKDRHWPNIVSLLIGGIPQLNGYKDPFFHHESRVGTSPTSYYICNIDENVSMVIIAESSRSSSNGPARPIIDFCRQVAPVLRMQHVFDSLKPLKFGNGK